MTRRSARDHGLVLAGYLLAALALTWPLARHFTTHVPGDGIDDPALAWNLWWIKARLVDQLNLDIFHTGWMFHPVSINLAFYTLTPLNGLLSVPLQGAFGLVAANNLVLLSSFVLGGYGAFLLARRGHRPARRIPRAFGWAALCCGVPLCLCRPQALLRVTRPVQHRRQPVDSLCRALCRAAAARQNPRAARCAGRMAGLFLVLQAWAELTFASFLLLFSRWQRAPRGQSAAQTCGSLQAISPASRRPQPRSWPASHRSCAAMLPDLRAEGDFFACGGGFADVFSADLPATSCPRGCIRCSGSLPAALPFPNDKGQQIFVGYVALIMGALGVLWLWRQRRGAGDLLAGGHGGSGC